MDMSGEKRVPAPRDKVWAGLNDPDALKAAIPGCESVEKKSDTEFAARVVMAIGPVKAKFSGAVTLADLDPPNGYTLSGQGSGGVAGFGKGEAKVSLREDGADTVIAYQVHASVGGKLAQVGQRLIDTTAKKLADQFFENFSQYLQAGGEEAAAAPAEAAPEKPAAKPAPAAAPQRASGLFWVLAAIALIALWYINH